MEKQILSQQENIKKFSQLLGENGMSDQKKEFDYLIQYIDQMENQFDTVLEELRSVKQELNTIQDKTFRATANKAVDKVTAKVNDAKNSLIKLKQHVLKTVDKAVNDFKRQGKSALTAAVKKLNVKGMIETIKKGLDSATKSMDQNIDYLSKLGNEIHEANSHLKNVGRMFIGKDTKEITPRNTNKGLISKTQENIFFCMSVFTKMSVKTDAVLNTLSELEKKEEPKKSVKSELKDIKKTNSEPANAKLKSKIEIHLGQR